MRRSCHSCSGILGCCWSPGRLNTASRLKGTSEPKSGINWVPVVFAALLTACGGNTGERVAGSAEMGGALGIPGGPIGIAVGAGVGAAAGALVPERVFEGSSQESEP
jgi:hypothetical protein